MKPKSILALILAAALTGCVHCVPYHGQCHIDTERNGSTFLVGPALVLGGTSAR